MKRFFLTLFLFPFSFYTFSQSPSQGNIYQYGREIVDTLASPGMHGRGYVNGGDSIAAFYLKTELRKLGVEPLGKDYYQNFSFPINTFPGNVEFQIGSRVAQFEHECISGKNYIIDASSPSVSADFRVRMFDSSMCSPKKLKKFLKKLPPDVFVLVDDLDVVDKNRKAILAGIKGNPMKAKGIIEPVKKLTWHQSQKVSDHCRVQLLADSTYLADRYHYDQGKLVVENKFIKDHPSQNVIGFVKGSVYPDSFIVFSAHYDHLGHMGKDVYFPGANDNASGCAMVLNLAKYYAENKPKCSVAFMLFAGEEVGLLGSDHYTRNPLFPLKNIKFVVNMDIMGTGEDGITVVNGTVFKKDFDKLKEINTSGNYVKDVKIRGESANSDHYHFAKKGVKAIFIYTMGGIKAYHDIYDKAETLPLNEFEDLFKLITQFGDYLQGSSSE